MGPCPWKRYGPQPFSGQVGDGDFFGRTMYFSTVALARWIPTLASSPTIRGDPQSGFALDIWRIRSRISLGTAGRPGVLREILAQWSRNLRRCQAMTVLGWTKTKTFRQPAHALDNHAHKKRSAIWVWTRGWRRW